MRVIIVAGIVSLVLLFTIGYVGVWRDRGDTRIVFVLPNNFRGVFFVREDGVNGVEPVVTNGNTYTFTVPENCLLVVKSFAPFGGWHVTEARYADGRILQNEEGSEAADVVLRELGGQVKGREKPIFIIGVGTLQEFHSWQREYGFSS